MKCMPRVEPEAMASMSVGDAGGWSHGEGTGPETLTLSHWRLPGRWRSLAGFGGRTAPQKTSAARRALVGFPGDCSERPIAGLGGARWRAFAAAGVMGEGWGGDGRWRGRGKAGRGRVSKALGLLWVSGYAWSAGLPQGTRGAIGAPRPAAARVARSRLTPRREAS
jgi:hypothetical protein